MWKKIDTEINVGDIGPALANGGDETDLPHRAGMLGKFNETMQVK